MLATALMAAETSRPNGPIRPSQRRECAVDLLGIRYPLAKINSNGNTNDCGEEYPREKF